MGLSFLFLLQTLDFNFVFLGVALFIVFQFFILIVDRAGLFALASSFLPVCVGRKIGELKQLRQSLTRLIHAH